MTTDTHKQDSTLQFRCPECGQSGPIDDALVALDYYQCQFCGHRIDLRDTANLLRDQGAARRELAHDGDSAVTGVNNQLVDTETGEVLGEYPDGATERLTRLIDDLLECGRQEKLWKQRAGMLKSKAEEALTSLGLERYESRRGSVGYRSRTTRKVDPARVVAVGEMEEWGQAAIIEVIHRSACELDAETFDAVMRELRLGAYVGECIEEKTSTWLQASENRKAL